MIYFPVTLPEVTYNVEIGTIVVHPTNRKQFRMRTLPVSVSFVMFDKLVSIYYCVLYPVRIYIV